MRFAAFTTVAASAGEATDSAGLLDNLRQQTILGGVVKRVCSRSSLPGVGQWPGMTPLSWHNGSPLRATA